MSCNMTKIRSADKDFAMLQESSATYTCQNANGAGMMFYGVSFSVLYIIGKIKITVLYMLSLM
jgi:hypothetical protein